MPEGDNTTVEVEETTGVTADQGDSGTASETEPEGAEQLGDPGKKALDAMKAARNEARAEARELRKQIEDLQAQFAAKDKSADEKAVDEAVRKATADATAKANARILRSEIRAAAAGKLADPADALAYLPLDTFEVSADGEVDSEAISEAISDLLERKPYLAAQTGPRFPANDAGATRNGSARPAQLTNQDVERMYAAKDYEGIEKARAEGRLNDVLGITA